MLSTQLSTHISFTITTPVRIMYLIEVTERGLISSLVLLNYGKAFEIVNHIIPVFILDHTAFSCLQWIAIFLVRDSRHVLMQLLFHALMFVEK